MAKKPPSFNPGALPPLPPGLGSSSKKTKRRPRETPKQVAQRRVAVAKAYESLTHAEFNQKWQDYQDIYAAYHGGRISKDYVAKLINKGISYTTFSKYLTKLPSFYSSSIWKQNKDKFAGPARNMGMPVNKKFIAEAIANNWDPYVFQEKLRTLPKFRKQYLASTEFKTSTFGLTEEYRKLYGDPNAEWQAAIQKAALGRWTPEQWTQKLRSLPEYVQSSEYQEKANTFRNLLGYV